jgi:excisionase family DNA binding protein
VQPDAGKRTVLAVSLLYTENTGSDRPEPLLTVRQVAELLGLCKTTVYRQCANGTLRHTRVAWAIRIARSDFEEFIESGTYPVARAQSQRLSPSLPEDDVEAVRAGTDQERADGELLASAALREGAGPEEA